MDLNVEVYAMQFPSPTHSLIYICKLTSGMDGNRKKDKKTWGQKVQKIHQENVQIDGLFDCY